MASTVEILMGRPIQFSETLNYIRLDFTMFVVEFYKGTAGYNVIYDRFGDVLVYDDRITLDYLSKAPDTWKQRGAPTGISWVKVSDYYYEVTRHYSDAATGTVYDVKYTVKSDSLLKITVTLKSGKMNIYRVAWNPSGIVKIDGRRTGNRLIFSSENNERDIGFDWEDVSQNFGDVTTSSIETVAQGRKANIYFNIGVMNVEQIVVIDPSIVSSAVVTDTNGPLRNVVNVGGYWFVFYVKSSNSYLYYKSSSDGVNWGTETVASHAAVSVATDWTVFTDATTIMVAYPTGTYNTGSQTATTQWSRTGTQSGGVITWNTQVQIMQSCGYNLFSIAKTGTYWWIAIEYFKDSAQYYRLNIYYSTNGSSWTNSIANLNICDPSNVGNRGGMVLVKSTLGTDYLLIITKPKGPSYTTCYYRKYTGTWDTSNLTFGTNANYYNIRSISAVCYNNEVHFIHVSAGDTGGIIYYNYWNGTSWSTNATVDSSTNLFPTLSAHPNNLYLFSIQSTTIYYRKMVYSTHSWDASTTTFVSGETSPSGLNSEQYPLTAQIGSTWRAGAASPYDVRFGFLILSVAYTQTISEVLGMLDSTAVRSARKQAISDILGLLDSTATRKTMRQAILDILGLLESAPPVASYHVAVSDVLGLLESATARSDFKRVISDLLGLVDSIIKKAELDRVETFTLIDFMNKKTILDRTETLILLDTITKFFSIEQLETLTLIDFITLTKQQIINLIEEMDISDVIYKKIMIEKTESIVFLDFFEKFNGIMLELAEEFSMADSILKSESRTLTETIPMRLFFHKVAYLFRQYTESVNMTDAISFVVYKSLVETMNIPDTLKKELIRTYTENMTLDNAITILMEKLFIENMNLMDVIDLHKFFDRILTEIIIMHDVVTKSNIRELTEMTNIADMIIVLQVIQLILREVLGASDSISKKSIKVLSESITLADLMTIQKLLTTIIKIMDKYPVIERQNLTAILDEIDRDGTLNTEEKTLTTRVVKKLFDLPLQNAEKTVEEIKRTLGISTENRDIQNVVDIKQEVTVEREERSATVKMRSDKMAILNIDFKKRKKRPGET